MSVNILCKFNNQLLVPSFKSLTSIWTCWHANSVENEHISPKNSLKISLKFCQFSITAARFSGPHRSSVTVCFGLSVFCFFFTQKSPPLHSRQGGVVVSPLDPKRRKKETISLSPHIKSKWPNTFGKKKYLNNYSNSWNFQLGLLWINVNF